MDSDNGGPSTDPATKPPPRRDSSHAEPESSQTSSAPKKPTVKKRTKTGCYTCRRRRIKCDEGKPRCNNCIKSKRQCDGYNQRVIFKDPMSTYQTNHGGPIIYQGGPDQPMLANSQIPPGAQYARTSAQGALPFIAPRPPAMTDMSTAVHPLHMQQDPRREQPPPPSPYTINPNAMSYVPPNPPTAPPGLPQYAPSWQPPPPPLAAGHSGNYAEAAQFRGPPFDGSISSASVPALPPHTAEWQAEGSRAGTSFSSAGPLHHQQITYSQVDEPVPNTEQKKENLYWDSDDDASMAASEDDDPSNQAVHLQSNDLGVLVANRLGPMDRLGTHLRSFSSFADANVLATYVPSSLNSPLNNAQTAAIFWYFINVTGPSMSLFERHPIDPSPIFQGQPVPRARQHIWTYTFPIISLNHPALLQAILALGSLQMAKLQEVPATASMKHYHLSLRRLARNYQSVSRRVQPATLAATMLLGFYEVWNSDHDKWCKHMWGARAILKEIPLRDMTHKIRILKRDQRARLESGLVENATFPFASVIVADRDIDQVDSALVATISGQPVRYEEDDNTFSSYTSTAAPTPTWTSSDHYTEKDIETFENYNDIFWWYCKMDVYQSILGATPLLMDYTCWTQCCPRAPIGKIVAIYGTYDHLMLLLGRVCHFSYRDQVRKRKSKRPDPPGNSQGQSPPMFAGMMPATGHVTIPTGFSPPRESSPQSDSQEEIDMDTRTTKALKEWDSIRQAFETFRAQLGPDFEPLGPEYELPASSPFGLALKYRTYSIASIWMNYYMGLIVLHRCHPSMPPIAMAAAAMAARQTAPYATEIGKIVAGLTVEDLSTLTHVSTLLGAVSIESSFPLFVAAVQYQDISQRHWTVRQMHNVARLTGWQSARQIAIGCERGWVKAASVGRGPPYESPPDLVEVPESIWNRPRRIIDRIREMDDDDEKIVLSSSERPQYAIGLLTVETDLEKLDLGKE